jgi:polysaccharide biosynthesis/export protein
LHALFAIFPRFRFLQGSVVLMLGPKGFARNERKISMKHIFTLAAALFVLPFFAASAVAQDSYRVKSGDVLQVEVLEDPSINRQVLVTPDGRISLPLAGTVLASGRSVDQVQAEIAGKLAPNFAAPPTVFVSVNSVAAPAPATYSGTSTIDVYVLGEVANAGKVSVSSGTNILQLLAEIGGFSDFAATKRIQLRRKDKSGSEKVYNINYQDILAGQSSIGTTTLATGDVIIVPQRRLFE